MVVSHELGGYEAVRASAAFFPIENGGRFRLLGPEAQDFLHRMVTNDVRALAPGQGCYATMLDINGRLIADLWVWLLDTENILIETNGATLQPLMATLDKYLIMEQVEIEPAENLALISVQGPKAVDALRTAKLDAPDLEPFGVWQTDADSAYMVVASRNRSGRGGVDVYMPIDKCEWLVSALANAGVEEGSAETLEALRVEAGLPAWGAELRTDVIPLEANLANVAVSFTKGCYPGQEIIARIHSRGRPAKHLTGIRFQGSPPAAGTAVEQSGANVGTITSRADSPDFGGIALATLRKEAGEPGTAVSAGGVSGTTTELPFHDG